MNPQPSVTAELGDEGGLRDWRDSAEGPVLVGSRCASCNKCVFPRSEFCDSCGEGAEMREVTLGRTGVLYSFTVVHMAPDAFEVPYVLGFVDLDEDVRVLAQIETSADLKIGDLLSVCIGSVSQSPEGARVLGYKFQRQEA